MSDCTKPDELPIHLCTLFDSKFLLQGITLIRSVQKYASGTIKWTVLALDSKTENYLKGLPDITIDVLTLKSLGDEQLLGLIGSRPWNEICWTSAACLLRNINQKTPIGGIAAYIDADCFFFNDIFLTLNNLKGDRTIAIHEHRFSPERAHWLPMSGRFNVGLVAGVKGSEFDKCLTRWRMQVLDNCAVDKENGQCGDQTYLNEWPSLYSGLLILDSKGIGLAPWNIGNYQINTHSNEIFVDDSPLHFYHFHALQFGLVTKIFQAFIPASGYKFKNREYKIIYFKYVDELSNSLNSISRFKWIILNTDVSWWFKGLLRRTILLCWTPPILFRNLGCRIRQKSKSYGNQ